MKIIAIANLKGGVGKTTTAAALGSMQAAAVRRVLVVDLDPNKPSLGRCYLETTASKAYRSDHADCALLIDRRPVT